MGKKNNAICSYLEKPEKFADFINGSLYNGRQILHPKQVTERQTVYTKEDKTRDILKMVCRNENYILIGIENQESIHYAMPIRCMEYDVLEYKKQLDDLKAKYDKKHRLSKKSDSPKMTDISDSQNLQEPSMSPDEFLSGFKKEDKLNPVTTIVFYHGTDIYDGCTNLHDMLNWEKENGNFKQYVPNYHINLVTLAGLDERNFQTGVREIIGFLKHSTSKTELKRYCMENEQRIQQMDDDTFNTVNTMIDWPYLVTWRKQSREGDKITMCQAVIEWEEELLQKGEERGFQKGEELGREQGIEAMVLDYSEEGFSDARIIEKLQKRFNLDPSSARNYFLKYSSNRENP